MTSVRFALLVLVAVVTVCGALPAERSAISCKLCTLAVDQYVGSADKSVTSIEKSFDEECNSLLKSIPFAAQECEKYINSKLDPIIKELEGGTAAKDVCTKLNEC